MSRLFDDSASDYMEESSALVGQESDFSVGCWAYFDDLTMVAGTLFSIGLSSSDNSYHILDMIGASDYIRAGTADNTGGFSSSDSATNSITANTWHFVGGVWEGNGSASTSRKSYVDTVASTADTGSRAMDACNRTAIGRLSRLTPANYMSGRIAEWWIRNVALTDDEMLQHNHFSALLIRPETLVSHVELWGRVSPEIDRIRGTFPVSSGTAVADHPAKIIRPKRRGVTVPVVAAVFDPSTGFPWPKQHQPPHPKREVVSYG